MKLVADDRGAAVAAAVDVNEPRVGAVAGAAVEAAVAVAAEAKLKPVELPRTVGQDTVDWDEDATCVDMAAPKLKDGTGTEDVTGA